MKCSLKFITAALRPGENHLKMGVVNLWINRLIGDAALPDNASFGKMGPRGRGITKIPGWLTDGGPRPVGNRKTFSTWLHFPTDAPLLESGLLWPVRLVFTRHAELKK